MTGRALTIAQTADEIRNALREYIEATYHVGHPSLIRQRQVLLDQQGNTFQTPFLESTPRYTPGRRFAELTLDKAALELFARLTSTEHDHAPLIFDPPYTHQAAALEAAASGRSLVVTTGTGSGKTETFLLPMLAKLAEEAANRPQSFAAPGVRALVLYPMNALVNDQLGRLRLLLERFARRLVSRGALKARERVVGRVEIAREPLARRRRTAQRMLVADSPDR